MLKGKTFDSTYTLVYILTSQTGGPKVLGKILQSNSKLRIPANVLLHKYKHDNDQIHGNTVLFGLTLDDDSIDTLSLILSTYEGRPITEDDLCTTVLNTLVLRNLSISMKGQEVLLTMMSKFPELCISNKNLSLRSGDKFRTLFTIEEALEATDTGKRILSLNKERSKVPSISKEERYVNNLLDNPMPASIANLLKHKKVEMYLFDVKTKLSHCLFISLLISKTTRQIFVEKLSELKFYSTRLKVDLLCTPIKTNYEVVPNPTPLFLIAETIKGSAVIEHIIRVDKNLIISKELLFTLHSNSYYGYENMSLFSLMSVTKNSIDALTEILNRIPNLHLTAADLCAQSYPDRKVTTLWNLAGIENGNELIWNLMQRFPNMMFSEDDFDFTVAIDSATQDKYVYSVRDFLRNYRVGNKILALNEERRQSLTAANRRELRDQQYVNGLLDNPCENNITALLKHKKVEKYLFDVETKLGHCLFISLLIEQDARYHFVEGLSKLNFYSKRMDKEMLCGFVNDANLGVKGNNITPLFLMLLVLDDGVKVFARVLDNDEHFHISREVLFQPYSATNNTFTNYTIFYILTTNNYYINTLVNICARQKDMRFNVNDLCTLVMQSKESVTNPLYGLASVECGQACLLTMMQADPSLFFDDEQLNFEPIYRLFIDTISSVQELFEETDLGKQILQRNSEARDKSRIVLARDQFFSSKLFHEAQESLTHVIAATKPK